MVQFSHSCAMSVSATKKLLARFDASIFVDLVKKGSQGVVRLRIWSGEVSHVSLLVRKISILTRKEFFFIRQPQ